MNNDRVSNLLIGETKRRLFEEGIPRIKRCLSLMSEDEVWHQTNGQTVSTGNLVLHLCGNVRQWILSGMGGREDDRTRDAEFELHSRVSKQALVNALDSLQQDVEPILDKLGAESLTAIHDVQLYKESGVSILVHVVEHFSYHVGQITYMMKAMKNLDAGYYADDEL